MIGSVIRRAMLVIPLLSCATPRQPAAADGTIGSAPALSVADLAGTYAFDVLIDGRAAKGLMKLTGDSLGNQGIIDTDGLPMAQVTSIRVTSPTSFMVGAMTTEGPLELR